MYLTTHLVRAASGKEGVNGFVHEHGLDFVWPDNASFLPEDNPGRLAQKRIELPPGGNAVRAYLDVLAPDSTPLHVVAHALEKTLNDLPKLPNPVAVHYGAVTIRFGVEAALEPSRRQYLRMLSAALVELGEARAA